MYNLELDKVIKEIKQRQTKRVLLQLPDGMRPFAYQLAKIIQEATDAKVILSGDSCYGACDLALTQAQALNADLIVHYGHSIMVHQTMIPVLYINAEIDIDAQALVNEALPYLKEWKSIGVVTTAQHIHQIKDVAKLLEEKGFKAYIGEGYGKTPNPGQILGCYYYNAQVINGDVDGFLYIGGGQFHPNGIILSTGKPIVIANPYNGKVSTKTEKDLMDLAKKRMAEITAAKNASTLGILVSTKPGQSVLKVAEELDTKFTEKGYESLIIYLDETRTEHLNNYTEPEFFINTACPRIAIDGITGIDRPMLTVKEAQVVLGERNWEDMWGNEYLD